MPENQKWPTFRDVLNAYSECRIGKPVSTHQTRFEMRLSENLLKLYREIQTRTYRPSRSICFVVTQPKPREIFAAHFRDRIVHHLIISRLTPTWERKFSPVSFACRKGRGTHGALKDFQRQVRRISQGGRKTVHVLQLDIASFFVSINRPTLCHLLMRETRDETLQWLIKTNVGHDCRTNYFMKSSRELQQLIPPNKSWLIRATDDGIPIGNLTSQFGANVYLNALDHWIVRELKPNGYLRYMDDMTLLDVDPEKLQTLIDPIDQWLQKNRTQHLNQKKTVLTPLPKGINYLGYRIVQTQNQKSPAKLLTPAAKKWELVRDARSLERLGIAAPRFLHPFACKHSHRKAQNRLSSLNARLSLMSHADSYACRKDVIECLIHATSLESMTLTQEGVWLERWLRISTKRNYKAIKLIQKRG